jgi:hypothetical protein
LLVALHLDDGEPVPLSRDGLPGRAAAASFARSAGAEMIVTFPAAARSRAAGKITPVGQPGELPRPPSGHAVAAAPGALRPAARSARYRPGARCVGDPRITGIW